MCIRDRKYDIPKGIYIKKVEMDSPAMDAGLQSGDVIRSVAGQEVARDVYKRQVDSVYLPVH